MATYEELWGTAKNSSLELGVIRILCSVVKVRQKIHSWTITWYPGFCHVSSLYMQNENLRSEKRWLQYIRAVQWASILMNHHGCMSDWLSDLENK